MLAVDGGRLMEEVRGLLIAHVSAELGRGGTAQKVQSPLDSHCNQVWRDVPVADGQRRVVQRGGTVASVSDAVAKDGCLGPLVKVRRVERPEVDGLPASLEESHSVESIKS